MPEPTFFTELDETVPFGVAFIPAHHTTAPEICLAPNPTPEPQRLTKREKRTLNIQQSDEEVERIKAIHAEMLGRLYTAKDGSIRALGLNDFLFIAPYNAQVRALQRALPNGARVGSVDRFQDRKLLSASFHMNRAD